MRTGLRRIPEKLSCEVLPMGDLTLPLMIAAAVLLLLVFIRIIRLPLKWAFKAALHAAVGFVALFVLNFIGSWIDVELEITCSTPSSRASSACRGSSSCWSSSTCCDPGCRKAGRRRHFAGRHLLPV